jgi:hypothetical protein
MLQIFYFTSHRLDIRNVNVYIKIRLPYICVKSPLYLCRLLVIEQLVDQCGTGKKQ